jgi:DNA-binding transcriptional regulator GbsR (MarR family)
VSAASDRAAADFIATVGADLADQGFPRIPAFVLMALTVAESGRMTAAELVAELGVSPAAISGAVRYLGLLGFVRTATEPGRRRHVYALGETAWYAASLDRSDRYEHLSRMLRTAAAGLTDRPAARARVDELAEFFAFLVRRMPELLEEWNAERGQAKRATSSS